MNSRWSRRFEKWVRLAPGIPRFGATRSQQSNRRRGQHLDRRRPCATRGLRAIDRSRRSHTLDHPGAQRLMLRKRTFHARVSPASQPIMIKLINLSAPDRRFVRMCQRLRDFIRMLVTMHSADERPSCTQFTKRMNGDSDGRQECSRTHGLRTVEQLPARNNSGSRRLDQFK